jgi:alanine racemase
MMEKLLNWVEISKEKLTHNVKTFKNLIGKDRILCPAVKANAYGHGITECAPTIVEAGADWLGVNSLEEAQKLRTAGIQCPIYIMGYIPRANLEETVKNGFRFVVYNEETLSDLDDICNRTRSEALTHLKLETGSNRQGIRKENIPDIIDLYKKNPLIKMEGAATHFANIEDRIEHEYADFQLGNFKAMLGIIKNLGFDPPYKHCANTAATILFPNTYFNMARTGIGTYGLWPSNETFISARHENAHADLKPVLTWKTKIAQIRNISEGEDVGYGCTYRAQRDGRIAILPIGYYEGLNRKLSNKGYVLINGRRAPIRGRVCMNMTIVDVTNIPDVKLEDEAVIIGAQGSEVISAENFAEWVGTINYEVVTHIHESIKRVLV